MKKANLSLHPTHLRTSCLPALVHLNTLGNLVRGLLDHEPEHDGGGSGETVPKYVLVGHIYAIHAGYVEVGMEGERVKHRLRRTYHVKMYCAWLLRRLTSATLPMGIPRAS